MFVAGNREDLISVSSLATVRQLPLFEKNMISGRQGRFPKAEEMIYTLLN